MNIPCWSDWTNEKPEQVERSPALCHRLVCHKEKATQNYFQAIKEKAFCNKAHQRMEAHAGCGRGDVL